MKISKLLAGILVPAALIISGCNRSNTPAAVPQGKWDPIKLGLAFQGSPTEISTAVDQAVQAVRRTEYEKAIAALDSVQSDQRITAAQKTALNNAIQQIKDKANAAAAAPAQ
jgi:hypothetical protein